MNVKLTIQEKLKDLRAERKLTLEELSEKIGISSSALGNYESNDFKDISHLSIIKLSEFYGVSPDYILGFTENRKHSGTEISELHLSDEMVDLLKSGKINNRLLCEMALHPDFAKMLADIEIYVDGIAAMQIKNLNALIDSVRTSIVERYNPSENDSTLRIMKAAYVEEDEYFSHVVNDDIDRIIYDLRQSHKHDSTSAPETSSVDILKDTLDSMANFNGSKAEQLMAIFCKQTQINYAKLTDSEKHSLLQILKKSNLLKGTVSQRGKKKKR